MARLEIVKRLSMPKRWPMKSSRCGATATMRSDFCLSVSGAGIFTGGEELSVEFRRGLLELRQKNGVEAGEGVAI